MTRPGPGEGVATGHRGVVFTTVATIPVSNNQENPYRYFISYVIDGGTFRSGVANLPHHIATATDVETLASDLSVDKADGRPVCILNFQLIAGPPRTGTER